MFTWKCKCILPPTLRQVRDRMAENCERMSEWQRSSSQINTLDNEKLVSINLNLCLSVTLFKSVICLQLNRM